MNSFLSYIFCVICRQKRVTLLSYMPCFPLFNRLRMQFCVDQSFCNGLNFLGFSCCLLFCVGGNPIGGLRKSQNKCFQMMMSCKKKKRRKSWKGFRQPYSEKKKKSNGPLMLISCWHEADYAVRQHSTLHLCTSLGFFVQNWREMTDLVGGGHSGGKKEPIAAVRPTWNWCMDVNTHKTLLVAAETLRLWNERVAFFKCRLWCD